MQLAGSAPGDCGNMAAPMKLSGNSCATRAHSSLQIAAHVLEEELGFAVELFVGGYSESGYSLVFLEFY